MTWVPPVSGTPSLERLIMVDDHEEQVRKRAHALWEDEGRPEGRALDHWLAAKNEADSETPEAALPDDVN